MLTVQPLLTQLSIILASSPWWTSSSHPFGGFCGIKSAKKVQHWRLLVRVYCILIVASLVGCFITFLYFLYCFNWMVHNFVMFFKQELLLPAEETTDNVLELSVLQTSSNGGLFPAILKILSNLWLAMQRMFNTLQQIPGFRHLRRQQLDFLNLLWLEIKWLICKYLHFLSCWSFSISQL